MLEQIYNDFTTKMLPAIQEGLTITRDYFMDLFGRYVKYLIATDAIEMLFWIFMIVAVWIMRDRVIEYAKKFAVNRNNPEHDESVVGTTIAATIIATCAIFGFTLGVFEKGKDLAQDIFIPEIRVYEELSNMYKVHQIQQQQNVNQ